MRPKGIVPGAQWLERLCGHIPDRYEQLVRYVGPRGKHSIATILKHYNGPDIGGLD